MSVNASGEQNIQGNNYRCRIPQRLNIRPRNLVEKNKTVNYSEVLYTRPKSASRPRDDAGQTMHSTARPTRMDREKPASAQKKTVTTPRKSILNENPAIGNKTAKQIITVPYAGKQKQMGKQTIKNFSTLPDQETIKKCEDLEAQQDESVKEYHFEGNQEEIDSITSRSEKVMRLKIHWQKMIVKFEGMKSDLNERQRMILELYASLRGTHQKLNALGHKSNLPPADELRVMNVAKMTPEQLLQLCSESKRQKKDFQLIAPLNTYINKMNNMPMKLVSLCEETLLKRKDIIDWIDSLRNQTQSCTVSSLKKKINEFHAENEMLNSSLSNAKSEFIKDLNEVFDFVNKCVDEAIALQLRTEELNCALSEVQSKNTDLQKQIYNVEQCRSHNNKSRIVELEKLLKEEKLMKVTMKDRLSRAEGQVKIGEDRAAQLEAALNQTCTQLRNLERTVQTLGEQNHRLQLDFNKELNKLNEMIKENTIHLEEIGDAREKLQTEKEDLEKRLEELSNHYNESLNNIKEEQSRNIAKIIEVEKKYNEEIEERIKRDSQIESLCTKLIESELRYKDTVTLLEEQRALLSNKGYELQVLQIELDKRITEIDEYRHSLSKQSVTIKEMEKNLSKSIELEEKLKYELNVKEKIISELKMSHKHVEEELQNRDLNINKYEEQVMSLKNHIQELQERLNAIENLRLLPEVVSEQNTKLDEMTRQNNYLSEALDKKNIEFEHFLGTIKDQEDILKQKEDVIKILSDKEEEQQNIIRLLKKNLEIRTHVDSEINQQLVKKNNEIKTLLSNLETYKEHIDQLEKIILSLEDQAKNTSIQKKRDEEKIYLLEKQIAKYEAYHLEYKKEIETPPDNLDKLIKILEEELSSPIETQPLINQDIYSHKERCTNKCQPQNEMIFQKTLNYDYYKDETVPAKIEMGNFVKKTYVPTKNGINEINNENMIHIPFRDSERMDTSQLLVADNDTFVPFKKLTNSGDRNVTKNLQHIVSDHLREEKKRKMLKLVRHRL